MLEGRDFTIFTDYKPWASHQQQSSQAPTSMSLGPENMVADTLSIPSPAPLPSTSTLVSPLSPTLSLPSLPSSAVLPPSDPFFSKFYVSFLPPLQLTCPFVSKMQSSPSLSVVSVPFRDKSLQCDSSTGSLLSLVPQQLRRQFFDLLHEASHHDVRASQRLISSRFVRPGLSCDVGIWARSCLQCQQSKIQTHIHLQCLQSLFLPKDSPTSTSMESSLAALSCHPPLISSPLQWFIL